MGGGHPSCYNLHSFEFGSATKLFGGYPPLRLEAPGAIAEGAPPSFNVSSAAAFLKVSAAAAAAV